MGSYFNLIFYARDSLQSNTMADACYSLVDSLNNIFSDYLPNSELNRLCAMAGIDSFVLLSPPLFEIFLQAEKAWQHTKGSFDITIGPLSKVWRKGRREKSFPHPDTISKATESIGWKNMVFDKDNHRVKLLHKNMQLDLGGIAAGYIAQKVAGFLTTKGIASALVDASGDIVCTNAPPGKKGWIIGINQPNETNKILAKNIELENGSISTSGDVFQFIEHKGKKYSHIIDPRTGYGVSFQRNVTVITSDGTRADWLATAFSIMPLCRVKKLAKKLNASFLIMQMKQGKLKQFSSTDFRNYWQKTN
jgi:thiamine biosynthesis lipoprotein